MGVYGAVRVTIAGGFAIKYTIEWTIASIVVTRQLMRSALLAQRGSPSTNSPLWLILSPQIAKYSYFQFIKQLIKLFLCFVSQSKQKLIDFLNLFIHCTNDRIIFFTGFTYHLFIYSDLSSNGFVFFISWFLRLYWIPF